MQIIPLAPADLAGAAEFIARLNLDPAQHIAYFGLEPPEIVTAIEQFTPPPPACGVLARADDRIVGLMLADQDPGLGRAWLHGPLVEHPDWLGVADKLYAAVLPFLAPEINEYELFCDHRNTNCSNFAALHDFRLHAEAAILNFERSSLARLPVVAGVELAAQDHAAFAQLHDSMFPRTYYSGQQIIDKFDPHTKLFTVSTADELQGYTYVKVEPEFGTGYIDFIGVAEASRGRGVGRQLLLTALHWMFSFASVQRVSLTLITTNDVAQKLYASAGFECERITRAYRKQLDQPGP